MVYIFLRMASLRHIIYFMCYSMVERLKDVDIDYIYRE